MNDNFLQWFRCFAHDLINKVSVAIISNDLNENIESYVDNVNRLLDESDHAQNI